VGYTNTFQTYWVLDPARKTKLTKNPQEVETNPEPLDSEITPSRQTETLMPDPELPEKGKRKKKDTTYWDETLGKREKFTRERKPCVLTVGTDPDHPTDEQA